MPESEPKPKAVKQGGTAPGHPWAAVLRSGTEVTIDEVAIGAAESDAAVKKIQSLAQHHNPALAPILGWGTEEGGMWVALEPDQGVPLNAILSRGALHPVAAAALGSAVLDGIAALHQAGVAMGGFDATAVRVTSNGEVRLAGHHRAAMRGTPSQSDLRSDVKSAGAVVCEAFGVDPSGGTPASTDIAPALVVTMRSMAGGAMGPSVDRAFRSYRETAGGVLAPDRMIQAQNELGLRAAGREVPSITPFLPHPPTSAEVPPATPVVAPIGRANIQTRVPEPAPDWTPAQLESRPAPRISTMPRAPAPVEESERPAWLVPAIAGIALIVLLAVGAGIYFATRSTGVEPAVTGQVSPSPASSPQAAGSPNPATPNGQAKPVPTFAPASAGQVTGVAIDPSSSCSAASACKMNVTVSFQVAPAAEDVAWTFRLFDRCSGQTTELPGDAVHAQEGWNTVNGDAAFTIPSNLKSAALVAVTSSPDQAASAPFAIGGNAC